MHSRLFLTSILAASLFFATGAMPALHAEPAPTHPAFQLTDAGLEVDAGALGKFTLEYPVLLDATKEQPAHKLIKKTPSPASATLEYEGGTQVFVSADSNGKVTIKLPSIPSDVKAVSVEMKIPIEFGDGGSWKIGSSGGAFPKDKPSMPHLYQDHARSIEITKAGRGLTLETPEYSFLQLTDNREWNWSIYNFRALVPTETIHDGISFTFDLHVK